MMAPDWAQRPPGSDPAAGSAAPFGDWRDPPVQRVTPGRPLPNSTRTPAPRGHIDPECADNSRATCVLVGPV